MVVKKTDTQALKELLLNKKHNLNAVKTNFNIAQAVYNLECHSLQDDINFLERQLEDK